MKQLIEAYILDHGKAWSKSSLRSERYRLIGCMSALDGNPETLWAYFESRGTKPYTRVTTWTRVCDFYAWLKKNRHVDFDSNPYADWREKNALQFKGAYQHRIPELSFDEARARIETIGDRIVREKCLQLLEGGLRYSESFTIDDEGYLRGKGGKIRRVYTDRRPEYDRSYSTLCRHLRGVGLTPHQLRKIRATHARRMGLSDEDMMKVFGWTTMETGKRYFAPLKDEELTAILKV